MRRKDAVYNWKALVDRELQDCQTRSAGVDLRDEVSRKNYSRLRVLNQKITDGLSAIAQAIKETLL